MPQKKITNRAQLIEAHASTYDGVKFFASLDAICAEDSLRAYVHLLKRAWNELNLSGVLCVDGLPTLYVTISENQVSAEDASGLHRKFWNQGLATILVIVDPNIVRIYSGLANPAETSTKDKPEDSLIETLSLVEYSLKINQLFIELATGSYYQQNKTFFDPQKTVDFYLLDNLGAMRDVLIEGENAFSPSEAHSLLARLLFTCYLIDRGIINLGDYEYCNCKSGAKLLDLLESTQKDITDVLNHLFEDLRDKFHGNMFEQDSSLELKKLNAARIETLVSFFKGNEIRKGQLTLGFWAYDFNWIPVETISSIYEDFLAKEDEKEKRTNGAFYTPRLLAEMVVDVALQDCASLENKRFLDPSCGSGVFLVILFNRLATEWMLKHSDADYNAKADALRSILKGQLCGVDINKTACRITCFSLYLAFLDQLDPPDIRNYMELTGKKLPSILKLKSPDADSPEVQVVFETDFLDSFDFLPKGFDFVVGNPPWAGRGTKQIAHKFMQEIPEYLNAHGKSSLLLPSKVFLNKTDEFQKEWLQSVTLEKVIQLSDYSFILFRNALCPCVIAKFSSQKPNIKSHILEYETPKVARIDIREGVIPISPVDRKHISLNTLLNAAGKEKIATVWKSNFWGTPRDIKFLELLSSMPTLGNIVGSVKHTQRWIMGFGFQPYSENDKSQPILPSWKESELFVDANNDFGLMLSEHDCVPINNQFPKLRRSPNSKIYYAPMVLITKGFTNVVFSDFNVRFRDTFKSITGPVDDKNLLLFASVYLRSNLAKNFLFHTSASWGIERDQVHGHEILRLPFPLPGNEYAAHDADKIIDHIAKKVKELKQQIDEEYLRVSENKDFELSSEYATFAEYRKKASDALQESFEPLIYKYFDLIDQEIMLVEDTVTISIPSSTPPNIDTDIPTLQTVDNNKIEAYQDGLFNYAYTLTAILNDWAKNARSEITVGASAKIDTQTCMAILTLEPKAENWIFQQEAVAGRFGQILLDLQAASTEHKSHLDYLRGQILFEADKLKIHLIKPLALVNWTRTVALNDAAEIYAKIAEARRETEGGLD